MPWIEATLRGQRVLARATDSGAFVTEAGRVEIRYKPQDGKAYRALDKNLEKVAGTKVFPDSHCVEAQPAEQTGSTASTAKKESKSSIAASMNANPQTPFAGEFIVYTDGACSGNPGPCGLGFVVVGPDGRTREGYEYLGHGTNNIAELTAVLRGVEAIADLAAPIRVHTDSSYSIGVLQKNWKPKVNQELITRIKLELKRRPNVRLIYVPGHAGVALNERADVLARTAVSSRSSNLTFQDFSLT